MRIDHQQMELFLAVFVMDGRDEHTAGVDTHHRARQEIRDGDAGLAHQLLRLIILMNAAQDDAILAGTVVERELQQLLRLLHGFAGLDLHSAEIALGEGVKVHKIGKQRLDLHVGKIDLLLHCGRCGRASAGLSSAVSGFLSESIGFMVGRKSVVLS